MARRFIRSRFTALAIVLAVVGTPALWVFPARGVTAAYYTNPDWQGTPFVTRVERYVNLETVAADPATFPQQQFSVEWNTWIRIDHSGPYGFALRSDDGSSLAIDGEELIDNGGLHVSTKRTATRIVGAGVHQLRVRFMQDLDVYDLTLAWTPPSETEDYIPANRLFLRRPSALLIYLTRRTEVIWVMSWFALALLVAGRIATREREITARDLRVATLKTSLALVSTIATVAAIEIGIRLVHYFRDDRRVLEARLQTGMTLPQASMRSFTLGEIFQPSPNEGIVYELKPNLRGNFIGQPLVTNSQGLRDFEYTVRKQPETFRIVGLGDSSLFGWGVAVEDSTLKVLERRLNEQGGGQKFEVLNFAVPTYNTAQEVEVFVSKCLDFDPDLVILSFNTNDYDVPEFMKLPDNLAGLRRWYVVDLATAAYERLAGATQTPLPAFDFRNRSLRLEQSARLDEDPALPEKYRYMVGAKGFVRAIDKLLDAARLRGIPLIIFDVKGYPGLHPSYVPDEFRDSQRALLERTSKEKGFHFLNTYPAYVDYLNTHPMAKYPEVFANSWIDSHPNPLAHSINADALLAYLKAHNLLDPHR